MAKNPLHPRLAVLDALRGVAAMGVCWFHLTQGDSTFLPRGILKSSGAFGWLGVEVFFVISGFVIPYALYRASYRASDYGTFLVKRIIRLDPPYLMGILVVLVLTYASAARDGFQGPAPQLSLAQVILHLGYINVFFGYPWLNPVFWTLAIELQYYLLIGLLFPAISHRSALVRMCSFVCLAGLALKIPAGQFVFHWLFLFMLGMAAFQLRAGIIKRWQFFLWAGIIGYGAWFAHGAIIAVTGIAAAVILALVEVEMKQPWLFLGSISYSLYLMHVPIGGRVINLSRNFAHTMPQRVAVLMTALGASVAAAWILHSYVEKPAQRWSSRIRYRKAASAPQPISCGSTMPDSQVVIAGA